MTSTRIIRACCGLLCSPHRCCAWPAAMTAAAIPTAQIGPNPTLPDIQQYLLPPMHIARVVGWKNKDETPSVAQGLAIHAFATGLQHPRSALRAAERRRAGGGIEGAAGGSIKRPKEIVMGYVESWATSGGNTGASNRITLAA